MKQFWNDLGGKLGVGLCGAGLLLVFLGWNGAASVDRVPSQFPYLISGGIGGLCLVLIGVGLLIVQNQRADRAELQATLRELRDALGVDANVAADQEFHLPPRRPTPPEYAAALRPDADETRIEFIDDGSSAVSGRSRGRRKPLTVEDA